MKILMALVCCCCITIASAQTKMSIEDSVKQTINTFFEGMHKKDTSLIRSTLSSTITMHTIQTNKKGESKVIVEAIENWFNQIVTLPPTIKKIEEKITFDAILKDDAMAMAWTPFELYFNDKFYSCGVNHFQLVRINNVWKINFIIDTRRLSCKTNNEIKKK